MKPLRLELKVRNNRLIKLREELGLSVKQLCEKLGMTITHYYSLERPGFRPFWAVDGKLKNAARRICEFHGVEPSYLWPEEIQAMQQNKAVTEATFEEIEQLMSPLQLDQLPAAFHDPADQIDARLLFDALPLRGRFVLEWRLKGWTYGEIGDELGLSSERVRQIEMQALKRCRRLAKLHKTVSPPTDSPPVGTGTPRQ